MMKDRRRRPREWSPYAAASAFGRVDVFILLGLVLFLGWLFSRGDLVGGYHWQWGELKAFLVRSTAEGMLPGLLLRGFAVTVRLGLWAMGLALLIGVPLGVFSAGRHGLAALPVQIYVNLIRNTPPLVLLFLLYFFAGSAFPVTSVEQALRSGPLWVNTLFTTLFAPEGQLDRMVAAVLTLGLYEGAYVTEIVRGGIESVHRNQWEASAALGFSRFQQVRLVIFPQAIRVMIPPLTGQFISTFKDSALASLISLPDLTFQALEVMAISRMTFEVWLSAGVLYLVLGILCAVFGQWLERRGRHWQRT